MLPIGGLLEIKNELVRYNLFIIIKVATLNKATAYIFTDMQTAERHGHAGECYETTAKRCGALLQWINMVRGSDETFIYFDFFCNVRWFTAQSPRTWRTATPRCTRLPLT